MKKKLLLCLFILFTLLGCSTQSARLPASQNSNSSNFSSDFDDDQIATRVKAALKPQIGKTHVGAIVGIYNKGKIEFLSFGETALGNNKRPTPETLFEIGSITKTFTGLLLARSIELGRVKASDKLESFKEEWKNQKAGSISLIELVTHRSGLPRLPCNLPLNNPKQPYQGYTENDLIVGLQDSSFNSQCTLLDHPTIKMNYSNWAFSILGYALASKENTQYESLLDELILKPLELNHTKINLNYEDRKKLATGYTLDFQKSNWKRHILQGQGAIKTSAIDLMKYAESYLHPEKTSIANSIKETMKTHYESKDGAIGYAWFIRPSGSIWHNGQTGGFYSLIKIYPKRDLAVFYMTNTARELKCFIQSVEKTPCN